MLVDYPILTLIVVLSVLGALLSYVAGSARAARWIALGFSLLVLALASFLLAGFLWPDAITLPKMVTPGAHTYYAVEKSPWVPTLNVNYFLGADELSVVLVFLNALLTPLALAISWDEHSRVLRHVPLHGDDDQRRVPVPGPVPVPRLLGGRPRPDVPPDRGLGRPAAELRGVQVLPVHVPRVASPLGRHLRVLLVLEPAHLRHDRDHLDPADPTRAARRPRVRWAPHRLRHEVADVAAPHVVAGRPRGGTDRRIRDPRGRPPQARRLRPHPVQRADAPDRGGRPVLAPGARRDYLDPVRRLCLHRPGRPEAPRRILQCEPHGVRDPRDRCGGVRLHLGRWVRPRRGPRLLGRDLPDVRPRPRVRGPLHGRRLARPHDRDAEHLGARRNCETGAAGRHLHDGLLPRLPRPPRSRRVRRGVQRLRRRVRGLRPPRLRARPHGHPHGGVLHLGDAAGHLRASKPAMGDDAGPPPLPGRAPRSPDGRLRRVRHLADPDLQRDLGVVAGNPRRALSCPSTPSSCRRRSWSSPRSPPRSSASPGANVRTSCGPSLSRAPASRRS